MRLALAFCLAVLSGTIGGSAVVRAATGPDLAVSLSAQFNPLNFGSNETFTATVTNGGSASAANVRVTNTLPISNVTYLSSTTSQGICSVVGHVVTCTLGFVGAGATVTASITVSESAPVGGNVNDTASAQAFDSADNALTDPTPSDDSASMSVPVVSNVPPVKTDIQVVGSSDNGSPRAGTLFILTWQVKNNQDQTANAVNFKDTLPGGLSFESASTNLGTCSVPATGSSGGTITCSTGGLAKGQTQVITLNVQAGLALGNVSDTGSATFDGMDTNPQNNSFTVTVKVQ